MKPPRSLLGRLRYEVEGALGKHDETPPIHVVGYRGFGTAKEVFVSGRVLHGKPVPEADEAAPWWRNLAHTYLRMESDEVPGARVELRFRDAVRQTVTVTEGYFRAWLRPQTPPAAGLWHPVELRVLDGEQTLTQATTHVLTPSPDARFGIISDLDDTVVRTDATNLIRMLRGVIFSNARTRLPFEGVAAFYQALHRGTAEDGLNPIFYVSSSPWNLYDLLVEFLEHRQIPVGPLLLRDWGLRGSSVPIGHRSHKMQAIRQILDTYDRLPFLLIGDSGQEDPEIYAEIVNHYPDRILGIYIRDVTGLAERRTAIERLAEEVHEAGSVLVLTEDTVAAARHAAEQGWINEEAVTSVKAEASRDHGSEPPAPEDDAVVIE